MAHLEGYETIEDVFNAIKDLCDIVSINSDGVVAFGPNAPTPCRNAVQNVINAWLAKTASERFPPPNVVAAWRNDL